ncbi:hypothetical protein [Paenibacillus taichungensis]
MILIKHVPAKDQAMVLIITNSPTQETPNENEILTDSKVPIADEIR